MQQGAHRAGDPGAGEYLDQAQKLVQKFMEATVPTGRAADRQRAANNTIQRSLIGQQAALAPAGATVEIRSQIAAENATNPNTPSRAPNPNPFIPNQRPPAPRRSRGNQENAGSTPATAIEINDSAMDFATNVQRAMSSIRRAHDSRENSSAPSITSGPARSLMSNEELFNRCSAFMTPIAGALTTFLQNQDLESMMGMD